MAAFCNMLGACSCCFPVRLGDLLHQLPHCLSDKIPHTLGPSDVPYLTKSSKQAHLDVFCPKDVGACQTAVYYTSLVQTYCDITRYHSNRGVSFLFCRVPQIWRSQSLYIIVAFFSRDHLFCLSPADTFFCLSPADTQTRGHGIPLYRPAGLWHPVDNPSHTFVGRCSTF